MQVLLRDSHNNLQIMENSLQSCLKLVDTTQAPHKDHQSTAITSSESSEYIFKSKSNWVLLQLSVYR